MVAHAGGRGARVCVFGIGITRRNNLGRVGVVIARPRPCATVPLVTVLDIENTSIRLLRFDGRKTLAGIRQNDERDGKQRTHSGDGDKGTHEKDETVERKEEFEAEAAGSTHLVPVHVEPDGALGGIYHGDEYGRCVYGRRE